MADLQTQRSRKKLDPGLHWQRLSRTVSLGYRKGTRTSTWWVREFQAGAGYRKESMALADDDEAANGDTVLDHGQAIAAAIKRARGAVVRSLSQTTVGEVVDAYLTHYQANSRDETHSQLATARKWIATDLRALPILTFTSNDILTWRDSLVTDSGVAKSTANRIRTVLVAALNYGHDHLDVPDPDRWRRVKPFSKVSRPRAEFLTAAQARKLVANMEPDFRALALGSLYTGGRYRELTLMLVADVNLRGRQVQFVHTKSGDSRDVPLSADGLKLFRRLVKGRAPDAYVFTQANGDHWRKSQQMRRMRRASKLAKLKKPVNFHQFRHTYASLLTQSGMPMRSIQELLGHADMRITVQHYSHLQPDHVAKQVTKHLPSFGDES